MIPVAKNYKTLFKLQGRVTALNAEFLVSHSLRYGDPVVVCHDRDFRSFINIEKEKICLKKGLELFSNANAYAKYRDVFHAYIDMTKREVLPKLPVPREAISREETEYFLGHISILWDFYGLTEFSYHDLAYQEFLQTGNAVLGRNLDDLGKLKFLGREMLNTFLFDEGIVHNLLRSIGRTFSIPDELTTFLFTEDIRALFSGADFRINTLQDRKQHYACASSADARVVIFSYEKAQKMWNDFSPPYTITTSVHGTVAQKGIARGRVIIVPMSFSMDLARNLEGRMNKGDILVAESTTPELMSLCRKAAAIVTDQGGMLSHAAIVSRELRIPCIIGTQKATRIFRDGDLVEVDANSGVVKIIY